jgi:sugar phosphate isomerase/epimerase
MLSLHHLTALDATPAELVALAAGVGCGAVSLFVYMADAHRHRYPMVEDVAVASLSTLLADHGLVVAALEVFPLTEAPLPEAFTEALFRGARLGARLATVHVHVADEGLAAERFIDFADLAAQYGIAAMLEFNPFSAVADIATATRIAESARPEAGIALDCLHFARTGADTAALARAAPRVRYVQLSDGPADCPADTRWREAIGDRLPPGAGQFPLADWLGLLRRDVLLDVEVPQRPALEAGVPAAERVGRAVAGARAVLARR